jgi:hypothetical protein
MEDVLRKSVYCLACFLLLAASAAAFAQSTFATLTGIVTDPTGAVVPGASVTATRVGTAATFTTVTDSAGSYRLLNLDAGRYRIETALSGFNSEARELELLARQTVRVDVRLAVAGAQESLTVTAQPNVIETDRATVDSSRSGDEIAKLALNFRASGSTSPIVVATLAPAVQQDRGGNIAVSGSFPFMTSFSVDGISTQRVRTGGPSRELFPSVESIEEFKVSSASNNAEFMQVTDITTTSKSGTNQLRGSAFWFFQDSALNAADRFAPLDAAGKAIKPQIESNAYGASAGGPLWRDRTFFFGTYEGVRRPNERTLSQVLPPDAWRGGDLSSLSTPLRNPFTGGTYANNQIPINPVSARALELLFERQNQSTGAAINRPNYIINAPGDFTVDGFDGRVDHSFTPTQRAFGRFTVKDVEDSGATGTWNTRQGTPFRRTEVRQLAAAHTSTFRGSWLNELRGGFSNTREITSYTNAAEGANIASQIGWAGLPGAPATGGFPHINFTDGSFIHSGGSKPFNILSRVYQVSDTVTWTPRAHTVKAGFDIQQVEYQDQISFFDGEELGRYFFSGSYTGNAFADFLLGIPTTTGYILPAPDVNPYATYYSLFVQDDWQASSNLTVNVGVRYDLRPPMADRSNQLGNFDRNFPGGRIIVPDAEALAKVPAFVRNSVPNTPFLTAAEAGLPERLRETDANNINPRFGFAWRPMGDNRTVVRGGVGYYTVPLLGSVNYSMVATVTAAAVNFANTPANFFVFPNISSAASAQNSVPVGTLDFRRANQMDMKDPQTLQWNATVERELWRNTGLRVSYVGSTTKDLIYSPDLNQVSSNSRGYAAVAGTRPFTDWNVVTTRDNGPESKYHALSIAGSRRMSAGLAFDASYTLAKHDSDAGGAVPQSYAAENGATALDIARAGDFGPVPFTRRHRFIGTFLYELPFGRDRRWLSTVGRGADLLIGGWDVTGILLKQSGPFLTPFFSNGDPSGTGTTTRGFTSTQRPDQTGDGNFDNPTVDAYFDRGAFVRPADNIGRFGNAAVGSLIGPGSTVFSTTLGKRFAIAGRSALRVEVAFSNLFNIENLDVNPSSLNITSSSFSRVTATQTVDQAGPRTIQFSLRYVF